MSKRQKKNVFDSERKRRPRLARRKTPRSKSKRVVGYATQTVQEAWTP
jgi:hypothetical protein